MSEEGTLIDKRQKGWSALDNWFVDDYGPEVGPYGYAVYCVILRHCDADGQGAFPGHKTIARKAGCSVAKVKQVLNQLADLKLINIIPRRREDGGQTSNAYEILDPPLPDSYPQPRGSYPQSPDDSPPATTDPAPSHEVATKKTPLNKTPDKQSPAEPAGEIPLVTDVYYKDAVQGKQENRKTYIYTCTGCGTDVVFDGLGQERECISCGHAYRLARERPKTATDPAMSYLYARVKSGNVARPFKGFSQEDKDRWREAAALTGLAGVKEWIDLAYDQGKRGADLAYFTLNAIAKYMRPPHQGNGRDTGRAAKRDTAEGLSDEALGINV